MATETTATAEERTNAQSENESGGTATTNQQNTDSQAGSQQSSESGSDGRSIDVLPKWAQDLIKETRSEAAGYRTKLRDTEDKIRKENLSESERATEEAVEAAKAEERAKSQGTLKTISAKAALAEARIINPSKSIKLLDLDSLEVTDDGEVKGLDEAIKSLTAEYPQLVEGNSTNPALGNRGGSGPATNNMNDVIRQAAGRR